MISILLVESTLISLAVIFFKITHVNIIHLNSNHPVYMNDFNTGNITISHLYG